MMTLDFTSLNFFAIALCIILSNALAIVWYSPVFLGKPYAAITGMKVTGPPNPRKLLIGISASILFVFTIAAFVQMLSIQTIIAALLLGIWIALGIIVAILLPIYVYNEFGIKLFLIDAGLAVVSTLLNTAILSQWLS